MKRTDLFITANNEIQTLSDEVSVGLHYAPTNSWDKRMSNAGKGFHK